MPTWTPKARVRRARTHTWRSLQVSSARKARKKARRKVYQAKPIVPFVTDRGWDKKKWLRADADLGPKMWKYATYLSEEVFLVGLGGIRNKFPTMYHICAQTKRHVIFARVLSENKQFTKCVECEWEVPESIKMLLDLQVLKKSRE